jgi:hypothetical protein
MGLGGIIIVWPMGYGCYEGNNSIMLMTLIMETTLIRVTTLIMVEKFLGLSSSFDVRHLK